MHSTRLLPWFAHDLAKARRLFFDKGAHVQILQSFFCCKTSFCTHARQPFMHFCVVDFFFATFMVVQMKVLVFEVCIHVAPVQSQKFPACFCFLFIAKHAETEASNKQWLFECDCAPTTS